MGLYRDHMSSVQQVEHMVKQVRLLNRDIANREEACKIYQIGKFYKDTEEDWLKWWSVKMRRVFFCTHAALRFMVSHKSGRIINIASIAGLGAQSLQSPGYSVTKAGVISLTIATALNVAGANIYFNAIACGGVLTPAFEV